MMTSLLYKRLFLLSFMGFATHAQALVVLQQLTVPSGVEYDSNVEMSVDDAQSAWRYFTTPTYTVSAVQDQNRWYSSLGLRLLRSSDKRLIVDREDPVVTIGWDRELEKGGFKLFGTYDKNSIRSVQLKRTGFVNVDGDETTKTLNAQWTRLLTERLNLTLGANLNKTHFSVGPLADYSIRNFISGLTYQVNEKVSTYGTATFSKYQAHSGEGFNDDINFQKYLGGINVEYSPGLNLTAGAGLGHFSGFGSIFLANAGFNYQFEKHSLNGRVERTAEIAGGQGDVQTSRIFALGYGYDLSNVSKLGSTFVWQKNDFELSLSNETMNLVGFYTRDLSDRWSMRVSLEYRTLQEQRQNTANGELAGITFIYTTPQF